MISQNVTPLMLQMLRDNLREHPVLLVSHTYMNFRKELVYYAHSERFELIVNQAPKFFTRDATEASTQYNDAESLYHPR
jgi:hypothetical protein